MRVALLSLDQVWEDKSANSAKAITYIEKASALKCELIIFPEMTLTGFSMNADDIAEVQDASPTIRQFSSLSNKYDIPIIFGVVLKKDSKATNNAVLVKPTGEVVNYSKIHPFSFAAEERYYESGHQIVSAFLNEYEFGLTICYDLRFPELYSILAQRCSAIVNIANWPKKRIDHWRTLLKARAIEQQIYIIGVNRTGTDGNGLDYEKSSYIIGPNGDILLPLTTVNEMDVYDVPMQQIYEFRKIFSTRQDRKVKFYIENYERF